MSAGMIACTVYLNCNFMINFLSFKWQCKSCLEIDDSLQNSGKAFFLCGNVEEKTRYLHLHRADNWCKSLECRGKIYVYEMFVNKNTRRASSLFGPMYTHCTQCKIGKLRLYPCERCGLCGIY